MAGEPETSASTSFATPERLWAEQLAAGIAILVAVLVFMAIFHRTMLSSGMSVLTTGYMPAYGWASALGVLFHLVVHEAATLLAAWRLKLPIRFRPFPLGANATGILKALPRQVWRDAAVGFAGPVAGTLASAVLAGIYLYTKEQDTVMGTGEPFFLGMACFGYFYNLLTLIPILDLEGGWIAPAIAPQAWLIGLVACAFELTHEFNLIQLAMLSFGLPRFILLIRARAPRTDQGCATWQRVVLNLGYFILVLVLSWLSATEFQHLASLVPAAMGD
jgi:hypothetical protein